MILVNGDLLHFFLSTFFKPVSAFYFKNIMFNLHPSSTLSYILATLGFLNFFFPLVSQYKYDKEAQHSHYIMEYQLVLICVVVVRILRSN